MRTTGEEGGQGWAAAGPSQPKALVLQENKLSQAFEGSEQHEWSSMSNLWVSASEGRPATGSTVATVSRGGFHGQVADSAQELVETCDVVFSSGGSVAG